MRPRLRLVGKSTLEELEYRVKRLEDVVDKFFTKWLAEADDTKQSNCPCGESLCDDIIDDEDKLLND